MYNTRKCEHYNIKNTQMNTKIQELTEKLYREGVEKGQKEANGILSDANVKNEALLKEAHKKADQIIAAAQKDAAELKKNTEAELNLFASQCVESLKSEVTNLLTDTIVRSNIKAATTDASFMKEAILNIAKNWNKDEPLVIEAAEETKLADYFKANAKALLNNGITIKEVQGKQTSFTIKPADGSYKVSFGEEEFIAFFKEFLRPQLIEMLF